MRFTGRGHPAVRATHAKTLELAPGSELTERGTCIVAVDAEPQPAQPMAGPVRIRIAAGGRSATVRAEANPSWDPAGPVVIRRGPLRLPGTFATGADTAAADLPRELVTALQDPDALVTVDVVAVPTDEPVVVLFAADPSRPDDPRLRAELAAAGTVEAQDAGARMLLGTRAGAGGGRRLVLATDGLPFAPTGGDTCVEVVGLPIQLAVVATAGASSYTVVPPDGDVRRALRHAPAATAVATGTTPRGLADLLAVAQDVRGSSACVVAQPYGPMARADATNPPTLFGRDPVFVCFTPAPGGDGLDPTVRAAVEGLLADGVPVKSAATALAALTGVSRRAAYDLVLAMRTARPAAH